MTEIDACDYETDKRTQELVDRLFEHQRRSMRLTAFLRGDDFRRYVVTASLSSVVPNCAFSCLFYEFGQRELTGSDDGNTWWHPTIEKAIDVALDNWEKRNEPLPTA
jgi:hypothetical protein